MQERYIAAIDLGSSKIALSVAKLSGRDIQVIYYDESPSDGIRYGSVFNPKKASIPVGEAIRKAEDELGIRIRQVVTGLPRYRVRQEMRPAKALRPNPDNCITREEIEAIKNDAIDTYPIEDETREILYGAINQSFSTEDLIQACEDDVIGCTGEFVEGNFKIYIGDRRPVANLDKLFAELDVTLAGSYFMPKVTADAVLTEEQKENGVALVEIGAGVTSVTIYSDNILRHFSSIPFGGKSVTADIKAESGFREKLCENIKLAFGNCQPDRLANMAEKVIQVNNNETGSSRQLKVYDLAEVIAARMDEIMETVLWQIEESGYADRLRTGIVLTGGGADLTGLVPMMRELAGCPVELGFPRRHFFSASGFPSMLQTGAVASAGLLLRAASEPGLNCVEAAPVRKVAEKPVEHEEEPTLILTAPSTEPEKPHPAPRPKPEKKPKEPRAPRTNLIWGNIKKLTGSLFDGFGDDFENAQ